MEMKSERRAIYKLYKPRDRYEIPDRTRDNVLNPQQKKKLMHSLSEG